VDTMSNLAPIPAHVPASRVYDFDFVNDRLLKPDPHLGLLELAKRAPPIFYTPHYGGHWVARSHQAIFDITHAPDMFSSDAGTARPMLPISSDPPEHTAYRSILLQAFAPKNVNALLPMIRQMAVDLVEKVRRSGRCEFVSAVAEPLPVIVFMNMLGLPLELMGELRRTIITFLNEGDQHRRDQINEEQLALLSPVLEARIRKREGDMLSHVLNATFDGQHATMDEVQRYLLFLTNAGLDTVTNAMAFGMRQLASDLELQARLRADPSIANAVVEEFLRRFAVSSVRRKATRDAEFGGVSFRKGDVLHLLIPAANLDADVYPEPERVILSREEPPVTFGTGVHRCLGSHLARLELRNVLTEWMARIPFFRLDPDRPPKVHAGFVYTVDELNLVWDAENARAV
jgi:cytochrome P450